MLPLEYGWFKTHIGLFWGSSLHLLFPLFLVTSCVEVSTLRGAWGPIRKVVKGIFVTRDRPFFFPWNVKWLIFSSWIVISIVAVNRDFPKCSLLFSVEREMPMLYFSWIVKGLLYFPWNVIYTPPLPPSIRNRKTAQKIVENRQTARNFVQNREPK